MHKISGVWYRTYLYSINFCACISCKTTLKLICISYINFIIPCSYETDGLAVDAKLLGHLLLFKKGVNSTRITKM